MKTIFNQKKAVQAAALFLKLRSGRMSYLKLIKLLYLADRGALIRWGRSITADQYVSMTHGPVLSRVYDFINGSVKPEAREFWDRHISPPADYEISMIADPGLADLSEAETELIEEVFAEHGRKSRWELVEFVHALPEWKDPEGGAVAIAYSDILKAAQKSELEIQSILEEIEHLAAIQATLYG